MIIYWLVFLLFYVMWLIRKRPHQRYASYWFKWGDRRMVVDRWKNRVVK